MSVVLAPASAREGARAFNRAGRHQAYRELSGFPVTRAPPERPMPELLALAREAEAHPKAPSQVEPDPSSARARVFPRQVRSAVRENLPARPVGRVGQAPRRRTPNPAS